MSVKYTLDETLKKISKLFETKNLNSLYQKNFINWKGIVKNTNIEYQECFAKYIYERLFNKNIPFIEQSSRKEYCKYDRILKLGNGEEQVQREFYRGERKIDTKYGNPIWFELPVHKNGKGIDLVFYNKEQENLSIIELKYKSKETLLRPILELQTYYQRIDWQAAISNLQSKTGITEVKGIHKIILIDSSSTLIYDTYLRIKNNNNSYLKKLINAFEIEFLFY